MLALAVLAMARFAPPNIIHIVADDLGWAEVSWHRADESRANGNGNGNGTGNGTGNGNGSVSEVRTPHLQALLDAGLELDRFYTHKICSPARCALLSGRAPIHVNVQNVVPEARNPKDAIGGFQGIARNFTCVGNLMQRGGYATAFVGKWDVGMATPDHHPRARGFDSWLGYWHHSNDYWTHAEETCGALPQKAVRDLWRYDAASGADGPATEYQNGPGCAQASQSPSNETCVFEEHLLTTAVQDVIRGHARSQRRQRRQGAGTAAAGNPLFLVWAMHLVHMPLQVPQAYLDRFSFVEDGHRRSMHAMVSYLDEGVGNVTATLKSEGMWNNTLVVFHADNGGEIMGAGVCGGNNWPLRGGKFSNWEGGIRVNAFVSGGALPPSRRGAKEEGLVAVQDWYATYAALAGVDATDHRAAAAGLPPVDGVDVWPLLSGARATSPRAEVQIGDSSTLEPNGDGDTLVGGVINGSYKLLLGAAGKLHTIDQDVTTGPLWPNASSHLVPLSHERTCGRKPKNGCLFDIFADPLEEHSLAEQMPGLFASMLARVDELQKGVYSPKRGGKDKAACTAAMGRYGGYWGPFVDV